MRISRSFTGAALLAACLAVPADAAAFKRYAGKTPQGRTVTVTTDDANVVRSARINWFSKSCSGRTARFQDLTKFVPPFDQAADGSFADSGVYRLRDGAFRFRVSTTIRGRLNGSTWSGTFRASAVIRRNGRVYGRCTLAPFRWTANPA